MDVWWRRNTRRVDTILCTRDARLTDHSSHMSFDRTSQFAFARQIKLWKLTSIAFVSSACIMIVELVAGRIVAPYIGVSIFAWTGVIGTVLAGVSLGNYVGGRLADRWASSQLLGILLTLSGIASLSILIVDILGRFTDLDSITAETLRLFAALGALTVLLFFVPCALLGTLSPVVARLGIRDLSQTGSIVGRIYAAGSLGSIVGTFLTGFWLISQFGTHKVVWGTGLLLAILGLLVLLRSRWLWALPLALLA
jgi:predicted membrane-bound spermidine synthase